MLQTLRSASCGKRTLAAAIGMARCMRHHATIMPTPTLAAALSWVLLSSGPAPQHIDCPKLIHDAEALVRILDSDHDGTLSHDEWLPYEQDILARFEKESASRGASYNPADVTMMTPNSL